VTVSGDFPGVHDLGDSAVGEHADCHDEQYLQAGLRHPEGMV